MRAPAARIQTESTQTFENDFVELGSALAFWAEEIHPTRSLLGGPLTPFTLAAWRRTLQAHPAYRALLSNDLEVLTAAATTQGLNTLLVPAELKRFVPEATTKARHTTLFAAKILLESVDRIIHLLDEVARPGEVKVSQRLGVPSTLFLSLERLYDALDESTSATGPRQRSLIETEQVDDEVWAQMVAELDMIRDQASDWDQKVLRRVLEVIAEKKGMVVCPSPKEEAFTEIQRLTGRSLTEIEAVLSDHPAVYRMMVGQRLRKVQRFQLLGRQPVSFKSVIGGLDALRTDFPHLFESRAPRIMHLRRLREGDPTLDARFRDYDRARRFKEQFGVNVTDQKVSKLYADLYDLDPPVKSSYEDLTESVLRDALPSYSLTEERRLGDSLWRWDFRLEALEPTGKVPPRLLVEVHGQDHFEPVARGRGDNPERRLAERRRIDDAKTVLGLEWLEASGGGTYMVIHHRVYDHVAGSDWFTEICEKIPGKQLPRWLYLRPAEGPGSDHWPGHNNGKDGLDPARRRFKRIGDIEAVWVR